MRALGTLRGMPRLRPLAQSWFSRRLTTSRLGLRGSGSGISQYQQDTRGQQGIAPSVFGGWATSFARKHRPTKERLGGDQRSIHFAADNLVFMLLFKLILDRHV
jgi:hypothetical protein